jgi:hypothetical protein
MNLGRAVYEAFITRNSSRGEKQETSRQMIFVIVVEPSLDMKSAL